MTVEPATAECVLGTDSREHQRIRIGAVLVGTVVRDGCFGMPMARSSNEELLAYREAIAACGNCQGDPAGKRCELGELVLTSTEPLLKRS